MKSQNLLGIVCGSVALAACGGGGGSDGIANPVSVTVPAWVAVGSGIQAQSANVDGGISDTDVTITFNADGSITFNTLRGNVTVTNANITSSSSGGFGELFNFAVPNGATADFVELVILDDASEPDLIALARLDLANTPLGYETSAVIGDTTAPSSLPSGTGNYTGFMVGSLLFGGELPDFDGDTNLDLQYDFVTADAVVDANFGTGDVTINFSGFTVPTAAGGSNALTGSALGGTASIGAGTSAYTGTLAGTVFNEAGIGYAVDGGVIGAFYGPTGGATAGAFDTQQTGGAGAQFVGNFAAN